MQMEIAKPQVPRLTGIKIRMRTMKHRTALKAISSPLLPTWGWVFGVFLTVLSLHGQEKEAESAQASSQPKLSETTMRILEAQALDSLSTPKPKVPEESQVQSTKKPKRETGGLIKEWLAPFEQKKEDEGSKTRSKKKPRKPLWTWFDPTAPLSDSEKRSKPRRWDGRRRTPQAFGSPTLTEPEGFTLFFIRY